MVAIRIIRFEELQNLIGLSRSTVWRMEEDGTFPKRVTLSAGAVGWHLHEVLEWLEQRQRGCLAPRGRHFTAA